MKKSFEGATQPKRRIEPFTFEEAQNLEEVLMKRYIKRHKGDPMVWIEEYAEPYREIIEKNPELYELYKLHKRNPEVFFNYMEALLKMKLH